MPTFPAPPGPFLSGLVAGLSIGVSGAAAVFAAVDAHRRALRRAVLMFSATALADTLGALAQDQDLPCRLAAQAFRLRDLARALARTAAE